jgi:peptide-methionine (S)-S-oxide reductase
VLFYANEIQKQEFEAAIERAATHWDNPIVTELTQLEKFYEAEPEHQDYFSHNPETGYCSIVIAPKIIKARRSYQTWFREET